MEIGSEFILDIEEAGNCSVSLLNAIDCYPNVTLTSSGRGAISMILKNIEPTYRKVLLPIYICDSVISVFKSYGYAISFYDLKHDLSPENIQVENVGIFFHMGYFGFETNKDVLKEINLMKEQSIIVIEDVTHTMFSNVYRANNSDYYIGSIRKWLGIPSGGFVAGKQKLRINNSIQSDFVNVRKTSFLLKKTYFDTKDEELKNRYLSGFQQAEELLDLDKEAYSIDEKSKSILKSVSLQELKNARRENYTFLTNNLNGYDFIRIIFDKLPENVTPLFVLVDAGEYRNKLRKYLAENKIYCPVHWPISDLIANEIESYDFGRMYDNLISIPCDQRYSLEDMKRIADVISLFGG